MFCILKLQFLKEYPAGAFAEERSDHVRTDIGESALCINNNKRCLTPDFYIKNEFTMCSQSYIGSGIYKILTQLTNFTTAKNCFTNNSRCAQFTGYNYLVKRGFVIGRIKLYD